MIDKTDDCLAFHSREKHDCLECTWEDRLDYFCSQKMHVQKVTGDGFCFLTSLQASLLANCNKGYSITTLCNMLMDHIVQHAIELSNFHFCQDKMLEECLDFFCNRNYNQDAVDIIVGAAAQALKCSLSIYYNNEGVLYVHEINVEGVEDRAHLLFSDNASHSMNNHYDAVLPFKYNWLPDPKDPLKLFPVLKDWMERTNQDLKVVRDIESEMEHLVLLEQQKEEQFRDNVSSQGSSDVLLLEDRSFFPSPESPDISIVGVEGLDDPAVQEIPDETATVHREKAATSGGNPEKAATEFQADEMRDSQSDTTKETRPPITDLSFLSGTSATSSVQADTSATNLSEAQREALIIARALWAGKPQEFNCQLVTEVPGELDGDCCFIVANCEHTWHSDSHDLRHFTMHTSGRKALEGRRKTGSCEGAYQCQEEECIFLKSTGAPNHTQFNNVRGLKECSMCGSICRRVLCGEKKRPKKIIEYHTELKLAIIWHYGKHTCPLKLDTTNQKKALDKTLDQVGKRPGVTIKEFAIQRCRQLFQQKDYTGLEKEADMYADPKVMKRLAHERQGENLHSEHSWDAVANLKRQAGKSATFNLIIRRPNWVAELSAWFSFQRSLTNTSSIGLAVAS